MNKIFLKNEYLTVTISKIGAEVISIKNANDEEFIHQKNDIIWDGQAPVLFPVCGRVYGEGLKIDGKIYKMPMHGFALNYDFDILEYSDDIAVLSLVSNDETKKVYPYDFEFIVTYKLLANSLDVCYEIINDSKTDMYFSVGSHEGYVIMDGLNGSSIHFEKDEKDAPYIFENPASPLKDDFISDDEKSVLKLSDKLFDGGASVVIPDIKSDYVILKDKNGKDIVKIEFEEFTNLVIWTRPYAQFICIEPWCGMAQREKITHNIKDMPSIEKIEPDAQFERHHIISIL